MKKSFIFGALLLCVTGLAACNGTKKAVDGSYDFIIYEKDATNEDLSDNKVVATYHIEYANCKTVAESLIKKGSIYFFSESSPDYLVMKNTQYGLSYSEGYFHDYAECAEGDQIDVSWSYTAVNGAMANFGIGETPLEGLKQYGFVINGWKE